MALTRTVIFGFRKRGPINRNAGRERRAMPFIRNERGFRFVRDRTKPGIESKRIPR